MELEKLVPKERYNKANKERFTWVHWHASIFLMPVQKDTKTGSFRKW